MFLNKSNELPKKFLDSRWSAEYKARAKVLFGAPRGALSRNQRDIANHSRKSVASLSLFPEVADAYRQFSQFSRFITLIRHRRYLGSDSRLSTRFLI